MWLLFQTLILCAAIAANFFSGMPLHGYLLGVACVLAAWTATRLVSLFLCNTRN
jgi:hypothetical protein